MNSTATDRKIKIIPPKANMNTEKKKKVKKINVAAYCRVSTAQEDQETSYEAQVAYFTKLITENPSWNLAGIYADDGISGTDMKKRDNFNAMMERCLQKDGDIDLILTKSISRFARNTVDCLSCIRKLKERNIAIYFEKEHINTLESTGELLITILSSQAQEESRNISENVKWGLKRKYEKGEMLVRRMFFFWQRHRWTAVYHSRRSRSGTIDLRKISGGGKPKQYCPITERKRYQNYQGKYRMEREFNSYHPNK